ncbi:MAG: ferrochelatase [Rhodocyclaceae bacterium]
MPVFLPEPEYKHGTKPQIGVLLVNLGTPEAPTTPALRRYLKQFLSDPRVVEIPRIMWLPFLNVVILNTRPAKSAIKYATIWTDEGSPLRIHTERQARMLHDWLGEAGHSQLIVDYAMRYGEPSIPAQLARLKEAHCTRILIVPLYPQYAASTTASSLDVVGDYMSRLRNTPELRFIRNFCDWPEYISTLADNVRRHWAQHGQPEKLVMSFHGVPRFSLDKGDNYHCECQKTGRLLAEALELRPHQYVVTFQSRFGKAQWLQPYTQPTLEEFARQGIKHADVICPGFVSDCLETLEEIAIECRTAFLEAGGGEFHYIPALNERPEWIAALGGLIQDHLGNWLSQPKPDAADLEASAARAIAMGATA